MGRVELCPPHDVGHGLGVQRVHGEHDRAGRCPRQGSKTEEENKCEERNQSVEYRVQRMEPQGLASEELPLSDEGGKRQWPVETRPFQGIRPPATGEGTFPVPGLDHRVLCDDPVVVVGEPVPQRVRVGRQSQKRDEETGPSTAHGERQAWVRREGMPAVIARGILDFRGVPAPSPVVSLPPPP
jgi:hypothetical protein